MKKEEYAAPMIETAAFETDDIITVSENLRLVEADVSAGAEAWNSAWKTMTLR